MSERPHFDLQSHSRHSDGALEPAGVVALAARAGVSLLALTDHDTVAGVDEALAAGAQQGVTVVPAIELSAVHEGREDLHILGYRIDHRDEALAALLAGFREQRRSRLTAMADRLRRLGFSLGEEVPVPTEPGGAVGRPHLAAAVLAEPANGERLRREGLDRDAGAFLGAYLVPGAPAYTPRSGPEVREAIEIVHRAGGVAVWAHPFWDVAGIPEVLTLVDRFASWGLDGVEAFYPFHEAAQTRAVAAHCAERGLLRTGSSDFHGPEHPRFCAFAAFELHGLVAELGVIEPEGAT
ncbi:MAG TPA: PHP domain-containing protein [Solirubrobacteraceae bacterium]|nr:PHP domain-containing protein [Solirubrobacteraceae bacterium]